MSTTQTYKCISNYAFIKSSPSLFSFTLGSLKKEDLIEVISINGLWAYFKYNNKNAYILTMYLQKVEKIVTGSITIRYLNTDTKAEIASPTTNNNLTLKSYTFTAPFIANYTVVDPSSKSVTLTTSNPTQEIIFYYKEIKIYGNITINYIDKDNNYNIADSNVYTNIELGTYTYNSLSIPNYKLVDDSSITVILTKESSNLVINFKYEKIILGEITIKYIDKDSLQEIHQSDLYTNLELKEYVYTAPVIDNYQIFGDISQSVVLSKDKPIQTIVFEYENKLLNLYTIPIDKYGITKGFITRVNNKTPYKDSEYAIAKANVEGIQKAIAYAEEKEYDTVKLPEGEYSICYFPNNGIVIKDVNFDGNNSKLKVMFDSTHFNPYDSKYRTCKNPDCTNYNKNVLFNDDGSCPICGRNYVYTGVPNSSGSVIALSPWSSNKSIKNLHLIGDLYERSWVDFDKKVSKFDCEAGVEWTYGAHLNGVNCTFENVEAEGFMGDGLTSSNGCRFGYSDYAFPIVNNQPNGQSYWGKLYYTLGGLDENGNEITNTPEQITTNKKMLRTALLTINQNSYSKEEVPYVMSLRGGGYNRYPSLVDQHFYIYFYDDSQNLIEIIDTEAWKNFNFPSNAKYVRGLLKNQSKDSFEWLLSFEMTHDCKMINCYSHDNHRGGVTGAGVDYIFDNVKMKNNGLSTNNCPIFPDPTRYQFNQEDSYSYKTTIKNCNIDTGFNGLLLGLYHSIIENCTFNNHSYSNIILYGINGCEILNNTFNVGNRIVFIDESTRIPPKKVYVHDNTFIKSGLGFDLSHDVTIENNIFSDGVSANGNIVRNNTFNGIDKDKGLTIKFIECYKNNFSDLPNDINFTTTSTESLQVKDCTFNNCNKVYTSNNNINFYNCEFNNSLLNRSLSYKNNIYGNVSTCTFTNSELLIATLINVSNWQGMTGSTIENSTLNNCILSCYYNSYTDSPLKFTLNNCTLNGSLKTINRQAYVNGKLTIVLNNCTLNLDSLESYHNLVLNNCTLLKNLPSTKNVTIN